MSEITGSCLCGSVSYTCSSDPAMTAVCHCKNCQKQTGTSFSLIVGVPESDLTLNGQESLAEYKDQGESGGLVYRRFCRNCGSPVLSIVESVPGVAFIKAEVQTTRR